MDALLLKLKGYRTLLFNGVLVPLASFILLAKDEAAVIGVDLKGIIADHLPTQYVAYGLLGLAAVNVVLRLITSTAAGVPTPPAVKE